MKKVFALIFLLLMLFIQFPANIGSHIPTYYLLVEKPTTLTYIIVFEGYNVRYRLDTFSIQCILEIDISNGEIEFTFNDITVENLPLLVTRIGTAQFMKILANSWFNALKLFKNTSVKPMSKTYVSVNGEIVEAYVVNETNGKSYRDPKTGLFLGGLIVFMLKHDVYEYVVNSLSYLVTVKPRDVIYKLSIVKIDIYAIASATLIIALLISFAAVKTLARHEEYEII